MTSLNGEAEPEVVVEAVGQGSAECRLLQEETKTESNGTFRIRGLQVNNPDRLVTEKMSGNLSWTSSIVDQLLKLVRQA